MRIKLDKSGIDKIRKLCEKRVTAVMQNCAIETMKYLTNFGYHVKHKAGPYGENGPGWTWHYAASWEASVNQVNVTIVTPSRNPLNDPTEGRYAPEWEEKTNNLCISTIRQAKLSDTIFVVNPQYYGRWLNDGGELQFTYWKTNDQPNRFMELCEAHFSATVDGIVREVKKTVQ